MDEEALFAFGSVLAALGGLLERKGACSTHELADTLESVAIMTSDAGAQYTGRARYIASWAQMIYAAAEGSEGACVQQAIQPRRIALSIESSASVI